MTALAHIGAIALGLLVCMAVCAFILSTALDDLAADPAAGQALTPREHAALELARQRRRARLGTLHTLGELAVPTVGCALLIWVPLAVSQGWI